MFYGFVQDIGSQVGFFFKNSKCCYSQFIVVDQVLIVFGDLLLVFLGDVYVGFDGFFEQCIFRGFQNIRSYIFFVLVQGEFYGCGYFGSIQEMVGVLVGEVGYGQEFGFQLVQVFWLLFYMVDYGECEYVLECFLGYIEQFFVLFLIS